MTCPTCVTLTHALDLPDMFPMLRGIFPKGVRFMTIDTRRADKAEAERDALRETVGRVQALVDSNPDHADTCGSVLTPGADYPCSCWQTDLRAALATTGEGQ